tara:strand:+ start:203 stop:448 length:246 start_codon:yes stop_codon:yes gene_type:complete
MAERFFIFGRSTCPFCINAADYCSASEVEYCFLDYANNPDILEDYKHFYGQETVPIILVNNLKTGKTRKIGGYTDLLDYLK